MIFLFQVIIQSLIWISGTVPENLGINDILHISVVSLNTCLPGI
jgi:hypothetical protein